MRQHQTVYQKLHAERIAKEEEERTVRQSKWLAGIHATLLIAIVALIIQALPEAIDQMFYENYELPAKGVK